MINKKYWVFFSSILFFGCFNEPRNTSLIDQYHLDILKINLETFQKDVLDFKFTTSKSKQNVEYIILNTNNGMKLNEVNKSVIDSSYMFFLSTRNNLLYIFEKDGTFISQHNNESLNLGVLSDFIIYDGKVAIWDGKKDIINIFKLSKNGSVLIKETNIKPTFEINSFWRLDSGDYLATVASWNVPVIENELLMTDSILETTKKGFYPKLKNADDNYILSHSFFHSFNNQIYFSHSTDNITFLFDITGKLLKNVEIGYGKSAPPELLNSLEKNASELSNYFFINGYTHIKNNFIHGKISKGLSPKKSFVADTLSKKIYIEERPFSSIFSNTIGSYKDKIVTLLIPGQYSFAKESDLLSDDVKNALKNGGYVMCLIDL